MVFDRIQRLRNDISPAHGLSEQVTWPAIFEALDPLEEPEDLVRLYVHEGLRLFEDRLVYQEEKDWCNKTIDEVASKWFHGVDCVKALERPIYFTSYLHKNYVSVGHDELKDYIEARLK